ncbi:MAG: SHOCT domain-containing protein [Lachnospiraceae bacterium]|nr:SHOCT domain-containing protein [Lachnospiraceae bacterium]
MTEEKKIIESINSYKKVVYKIVIVSLVIVILGFYASKILSKLEDRSWNIYRNISLSSTLSDEKVQRAQKKWRNILDAYEFAQATTVISGIVFWCMLLFYWYVNGMQIIITNKRVYGRTAFGKQVDLPIDSVSAVGTSIFKGITIATSSGRINFHGISNRDEIHTVVSRLLVERQDFNRKKVIYQETQSSTDELKKYKELLDSGVITQEEFDAKKKQLLGL